MRVNHSFVFPGKPPSVTGFSRVRPAHAAADTLSHGAPDTGTRAPPPVRTATGYCRLSVPIEDRRVRDVTGTVVADIQPQIGGTITHWASPERAMAWWASAYQMLTDTKRRGDLTGVINTTDLAANRAMADKQYNYVLQIVQSIANGYNCLNLPWHMDPVARGLYRKWVSGPPVISAGSGESSVFLETEDYNSQWYAGNSLLPGIRNGASQIQNAAMPTHGKTGKPGDKLAISALLSLAVSVPGWSTQVPVEYAPAVYNTAIVRMAFQQWCLGGVPFPWTEQCKPDTRGVGIVVATENQRIRVFTPSGAQLRDGFDDWRCTYAGSGFGAGSMVTAPLVDYLPYLQEWVTQLLTRTADQIIQDTRQFVVYCNSRTIQLNGGPDQALTRAFGASADIFKQQHTADPGWQSASRGIAALGAAAATIPVYGQVVGLILGATAAAISVGDQLSTHGVMGHGRDDLGRYKLVFERGWLATSDPSTQDASVGQPSFPADLANWILSPPGNWSDDSCDSGAAGTRPPLLPPTGSSSSSGVNPGLIFLGIAALLGIGYAFSKRRR